MKQALRKASGIGELQDGCRHSYGVLLDDQIILTYHYLINPIDNLSNNDKLSA